MTTEIQKHQEGPLAVMKSYLSDESIKKRFEDMLGSRAAAFTNSIINVVGGSPQLLEVASKNPGSIGRAAMRAATVNLAIDPALGHAAIVPYGSEAVFQIMYRGIIQLCIRSGQYQTIHCSEIYRDELKGHNPITGEVTFHDPSTFKVRYSESRTDGDVVGHYVYFTLMGGFERSDYMTHAEVMAHARKYSKAYQYDLRNGKKSCPWSTDPIPMGNKTVLLRCLKRFGVMSIELQEMIRQDSFEEAQQQSSDYIDKDMGSELVDTERQAQSPAKGRGRRKKVESQQKQETTESEEKPEFMGDEPPAGVDPETGEVKKAGFLCKGKCGKTFSELATIKGPSGTIYVCPNCRSMNFEAIEQGKQGT